MKIRAITLNNLRRFTEPARVEGIGDGLNVLCEPNEHGKSTLFDAIQALFFKPHGSRDKEVGSLRPHAGGAPEVTVEVETDAGTAVIFKRWFQKPAATVHRDGKLIAQADEAEAWITDLLGDDAGGPSGLIWVRQGMTDLTGGSVKEQKLALEARRDLMTSVGAEVEAMTGGRRMDKALARCREELAHYATGTGRAKANGPWKTALDQVEDLTTRRDALADTAQDLHDALAERKRARRSLQDLEDPDAVAARREKLDTARAAFAAAERHAEDIATAARKVEMARLTAQTARTRRDRLREATAERAEAAAQVAAAETQATAAQAAHDRQHGTRETAEQALATAQTTLKAAEDKLTRAQRAQAARDGAARRAELETRIEAAETARQAKETAAAARTGPDAKTLARIEALAQTHATALATRDATATQVIAHYTAGQDGAIRAGDLTLRDGLPLPLPRTTRLSLPGLGELEVRPADAGHDDHTVDSAAQALHAALRKADVADLNHARTAAAARQEAERQHGESAAVLASLAPDGIAQLREMLARIPQVDATDDAADPDPEAAETALNAARQAHETARLARDTASERLADLRDDATRAETTLTSLRDRLARADAALAKLDTQSEEQLAADLAQADQALAEAETAHAETTRNAPDLSSAKASLSRANSVEAGARDEIARLRPQLAQLQERISRSSGDAVEERLAETEQALAAAQANLARIEHEVAVLTRLEQALEAARNEARERYFTPIARELKPLLQLLWPDAELTWGEESLLPHALIRDGREEPINVLSGGTQEQVALLVRLAFARMLSHAGRVAPVILDDALVFTDDDRIERMFDALHRQADDLQIIVLTCRQRAFRDLGGNALRLGAAQGD